MRLLGPRRAYLWWAAGFSSALEGFWVLSTVYAITEVGLGPFELVMLGTALEITVLVSEVPTGVVADALSRKWSVVLSMMIIAAGFILTGLSESFWPILAAEMLWGLGWTFTSGADTAWITDEILHTGQSHDVVDKTIAAATRWWHYGGILGLAVFGPVGYFLSVRGAIIASGLWMIVIGLMVATSWEEHGFSRARLNPFANGIRILKNGWNLARMDKTILNVLVVSVMFNFGAEAVDRLTDLRLIDLGVPLEDEPVVFISALAAVSWLIGAGFLHWSERRIERPGEGRRLYTYFAAVAALGTAIVALAPDLGPGVVGSILTRGVAWSVLPMIAEVMVNRQADSTSRATIQSFLGQAESVGEIGGGILLGLVVRQFDVPLALLGAVLFFTASAIYIWRSHPGMSLTRL